MAHPLCLSSSAGGAYSLGVLDHAAMSQARPPGGEGAVAALDD